jgi:hypothetical protein
LNINNIVLQIIPRENLLIFIPGREEFGEHMRKVPVGQERELFVAKVMSPLSLWMLNGGIPDIANLH